LLKSWLPRVRWGKRKWNIYSNSKNIFIWVSVTQVSNVAHGSLVPEVIALGLRKISWIFSFPHFFFSASRYFILVYLIFETLLCHTKLQIKFEFGFDPLYFHEVIIIIYGPRIPRNIPNYQFFAHFFSLLTDIHLIFGTLLCHTRIHIKFEFCFNPLIFSSPELKAQVSFSDRLFSVVCLSVHLSIRLTSVCKTFTFSTSSPEPLG
jgi:hypothetical protein